MNGRSVSSNRWNQERQQQERTEAMKDFWQVAMRSGWLPRRTPRALLDKNPRRPMSHTITSGQMGGIMCVPPCDTEAFQAMVVSLVRAGQDFYINELVSPTFAMYFDFDMQLLASACEAADDSSGISDPAPAVVPKLQRTRRRNPFIKVDPYDDSSSSSSSEAAERSRNRTGPRFLRMHEYIRILQLAVRCFYDPDVIKAVSFRRPISLVDGPVPVVPGRRWRLIDNLDAMPDMHVRKLLDAIVLDTEDRPMEAKVPLTPRIKRGLHIVFPNLIVNGEYALLIRQAAIYWFDNLYPPESVGLEASSWSGAIDGGVYCNGLRMPFSAKASNCEVCKGSAVDPVVASTASCKPPLAKKLKTAPVLIPQTDPGSVQQQQGLDDRDPTRPASAWDFYYNTGTDTTNKVGPLLVPSPSASQQRALQIYQKPPPRKANVLNTAMRMLQHRPPTCDNCCGKGKIFEMRHYAPVCKMNWNLQCYRGFMLGEMRKFPSDTYHQCCIRRNARLSQGFVRMRSIQIEDRKLLQRVLTRKVPMFDPHAPLKLKFAIHSAPSSAIVVPDGCARLESVQSFIQQVIGKTYHAYANVNVDLLYYVNHGASSTARHHYVAKVVGAGASFCYNLGDRHNTQEAYMTFHMKDAYVRCTCMCDKLRGASPGMRCKDYRSVSFPLPGEVILLLFGFQELICFKEAKAHGTALLHRPIERAASGKDPAGHNKARILEQRCVNMLETRPSVVAKQQPVSAYHSRLAEEVAAGTPAHDNNDNNSCSNKSTSQEQGEPGDETDTSELPSNSNSGSTSNALIVARSDPPPITPPARPSYVPLVRFGDDLHIEPEEPLTLTFNHHHAPGALSVPRDRWDMTKTTSVTPRKRPNPTLDSTYSSDNP